jgi:hypothetical protein
VINEIQHLFAAVVARPVQDLSHRLRWSAWPRRQSSPRPHLALPTTGSLGPMKITISGWSTDMERLVNVGVCLVDGMIWRG